MIKVMKVTKECFETEDEKVYFWEPLEKIIPVKALQKIVDQSYKMVTILKYQFYKREALKDEQGLYL